MNHECPADRPAESPHPGPQFIPIRVGRIARQRLYLGLDRDLLPQNLDRAGTFLDPTPKGVVRLKSDEEHHVRSNRSNPHRITGVVPLQHHSAPIRQIFKYVL